MTYSQKLKDPRWQKKRLEVLHRDNFTCGLCGDTKSPLHVHHRYYVSSRMPWEYPDFCYQVLCESCHYRKKALAEDAREHGENDYEDWEIALDNLGENIVEVMERECFRDDYLEAHKQP